MQRWSFVIRRHNLIYGKNYINIIIMCNKQLFIIHNWFIGSEWIYFILVIIISIITIIIGMASSCNQIHTTSINTSIFLIWRFSFGSIQWLMHLVDLVSNQEARNALLFLASCQTTPMTPYLNRGTVMQYHFIIIISDQCNWRNTYYRHHVGKWSEGFCEIWQNLCNWLKKKTTKT